MARTACAGVVPADGALERAGAGEPCGSSGPARSRAAAGSLAYLVLGGRQSGHVLPLERGEAELLPAVHSGGGGAGRSRLVVGGVGGDEPGTLAVRGSAPDSLALDRVCLDSGGSSDLRRDELAGVRPLDVGRW